MFCLFLFKQKTAYGMRISDWSSDVCSSDLRAPRRAIGPIFDIPAIVPRQRDMLPAQWRDVARDLVGRADVSQRHFEIASVPQDDGGDEQVEAGGAISLVFEPPITQFAELVKEEREIGRASCRERVCEYG